MVQNKGNQESEMCSSEKYYESIDFSNHCRKFYIERMKAADDIKEKVKQEADDKVKNDQSSAISSAMAKLRAEMASLVDQDISLMRQLLTLNETIEEIKQKRLYGVSKDSITASSVYLSDSVGSVSDTDMYFKDDDDAQKISVEYSNDKATEPVKQTTL